MEKVKIALSFVFLLSLVGVLCYGFHIMTPAERDHVMPYIMDTP